MQAIVVNSGREVTMYRVAGRIQVRHHYDHDSYTARGGALQRSIQMSGL
jgi:hypothetical protein